MSSPPRVTVFIPVHNRQHYIVTAVDSILEQTYTDLELLIVDDGSTDATLDVLAQYRDPRLRVETNPGNLGIPATRNRGLALARGEYIALLDSDDRAWPERLTRQVAMLDRHPELAQIGSACNFMDEHGRMLKRVRRRPVSAAEVDASLPFYCALTNRTILARTALLREIGGYDESFPRCQDYDLHQRLSRTHRMANLPQILVCGREHAARFTRQTGEVGRERKEAICRRALEEIGLAPSQEELAGHYDLSRPGKLGEALTADYLIWAEQWLRRIEQANHHSRRHQPEALAAVTSGRWAGLCWRARHAFSPQLGQTLLRSPLTRRWPARLMHYWYHHRIGISAA
ncbi:glycosyltransferase family 2 protein [Kushneria phosphatilytica]|uniref:Glycosyltransferase n=1 Tax=Kushneria phosphatilytica TaxID=657387 RepID=A0A1S1NQG3_9GAMM|nr:glycosyltransferase [Kushneria phosphatilytica]OHV07733.1 family 2 glycosyl transferase [Kushneria phosphatilytica]QEL10236.1 glycosyltransferase [Kushneria phosphatilytica]